MKHLKHKQAVIFFQLLMMVVLVGCLPSVTDETSQQDIPPSVTFTETGQPTKTFTPTGSPTITDSPLPTQTSTLTASPMVPTPPQITNTSVPIILPTNTKRKVSNPTATPTPSITQTVTPTVTSCLPPTPEPLWVDPVTSPTDQLSQIIKVYVGAGKEVTVTSESGTFTVTGNFNSYTNPALVQISLLPGVTHHLAVSARIRAEGNGCIYSYVLNTWMDKQGAPLEIVQGISVP